ncbi:hypothetical protein NQ152_11175 [Microbacterium sp. zg.B48]|uniref:hypothetical protein n=1 Tax=Microbacterium sp. zg.B48 TaxID=2969408 RepID=UPI00214CCE8D|nr:hypothetical protein [Microbacterium sp. zg.B48]MCR2764066.1 hypothetical protein [Microbacterium sp. zg.B48]
MIHHRLAAGTLAVVVALGITACSPAGPSAGGFQSTDAPGDEGQSTADACALIQESIEAATSEFENAAANDPGSVVESMRGAAQRITEAAGEITNDDVAAFLPRLQQMFADAGDVMEAVVQGDASKIEDLAELGTKFQETSNDFQEICQS